MLWPSPGGPGRPPRTGGGTVEGVNRRTSCIDRMYNSSCPAVPAVGPGTGLPPAGLPSGTRTAPRNSSSCPAVGASRWRPSPKTIPSTSVSGSPALGLTTRSAHQGNYAARRRYPDARRQRHRMLPGQTAGPLTGLGAATARRAMTGSPGWPAGRTSLDNHALTRRLRGESGTTALTSRRADVVNMGATAAAQLSQPFPDPRIRPR